MTMDDGLTWLRGFSQHTLVATLHLLAQEAGEGWLRLPFDPLNRLSADATDLLPIVLGHWVAGLFGIGSGTEAGTSRG